MVGIYKITSPSGKVYIGQSWDIERRFKKNYRSVSLCKNQRKLHESFTRFGISSHSFSVCHELPCDVSQEVLDQYELFYLSTFKELRFEMLNIRNAGGRGKHSPETIQRMKGVAGKWMLGKKDSEEARLNKSLAAKGKPKPARSAIHSLRISLANKGKRDSVMKAVSQYSLEGIWIRDWESIKDANRGLKINSSNIVSVCKSDRNHAGGFIWKYKITS